jgi:alpha-glucosidase
VRSVTRRPSLGRWTSAAAATRGREATTGSPSSSASPNSLSNYYKHLLRVRKNSPALIEGDYLPLHQSAKDYFAFLRTSAKQTVLVVLNYSEKHLKLGFSNIEQIKNASLHVLFSSATRSLLELDPNQLHIGAFEVFIAEAK